jgi:hypothetical protein
MVGLIRWPSTREVVLFFGSLGSAHIEKCSPLTPLSNHLLGLGFKAATFGAEQEAMKADWAHVFLSVLPQLPLETVKDETRIALALKTACANLMTKYLPPPPIPQLPFQDGRQ